MGLCTSRTESWLLRELLSLIAPRATLRQSVNSETYGE